MITKFNLPKLQTRTVNLPIEHIENFVDMHVKLSREIHELSIENRKLLNELEELKESRRPRMNFSPEELGNILEALVLRYQTRHNEKYT